MTNQTEDLKVEKNDEKQQKNQDVKTEEESEFKKNVPEKFKNPDGQINVDALLKSYLALEKKLSQRETIPQNRPVKASDYQIEIKSNLMKNDSEINQKLFDLGFTNEQVQAVYDLAADKVIPIILGLSDAFKTDRDLSELEQFFGGSERFNTVARQISAWGEKNLDKPVFETLAGSKDGILTMYRMMTSNSEESVLPRSGNTVPQDSEETLKRLMQDPKYWKQQDPALTKRIEDGFKRLYGG